MIPCVRMWKRFERPGSGGAMLTRQLLTFSRRAPSQTEVLDLNDVVQDMHKLFRRLVRESIELRTIPGAELWTIQADAGQMEQVIMNLVVNARDVMPEGGILSIETANVKLDGAFFTSHEMTGVTGDYVMLAVTDTGPGMEENIRERIFDPFFTTKERAPERDWGFPSCTGSSNSAKATSGPAVSRVKEPL